MNRTSVFPFGTGTTASGFLSQNRLARLADCDRSVIARLVNQQKLPVDACLVNGPKGTSPLFAPDRVNEVKTILAGETRRTRGGVL